jgi:hypothetical protein
MTNNTCFVTTLENKLCKLNKNHIFHDLSYYLLRNIDKFMAKNRIKIYSVVCIIIFLRLYDYYVPNASNASNKYKKIKIQGHRGARGMLPENTLAALKYAIENKIDVLELDLQMTKDKEIVDLKKQIAELLEKQNQTNNIINSHNTTTTNNNTTNNYDNNNNTNSHNNCKLALKFIF